MSNILKVELKPPVMDAVANLEIARALSNLIRRNAEKDLTAARARWAKKLRQLRARIKNQALRDSQRLAKAQAQANFLVMQRSYNDTVKAANQDCLALALSVAEEIVGDTIVTNQASLVKRIRNALASLLDLRNIKVLVHKDFVKVVQRELKKEFPETPISVEVNSELQVGNALVETVSGSIELNWKDHFNLIRDKLFANLEREMFNAQPGTSNA